MSAQQLIIEHIDLWTSTIKAKNTRGRGSSKKRELYGIKKLRELILELAVRGKLVRQDPNDEPASVLLKHIATEKKKLIKDKKTKKKKSLPEISDEEKTFNLPNGWEWIRWRNMAQWAIGSGFPKSAQGEVDQEFLFAKVSDMNLPGNERFIEETVNSVSSEVVKSIKAKIHPVGTVVFPKIGGAIATNKRRILSRPTAIDNNCLGLIPSVGLSTEYLFLILKSIDLVDYQSGTSVPALSQSSLELIVEGIPPRAEQHRIVAKVDELMTLCDQLEQQTESSLGAHNMLIDTLLTTLTNAHDAKELSDNWVRLADHFDTLITTDYAVEQLKQTILQLAVQGKLVSQDPNDEPASELLKRIAAEKEQLVKYKKIKKQKPLPEITDEEMPFKSPKGWGWKKLGELSYVFSGNSFKSGDFNETGGTRVIKITNAGVGEIIETNDFLPKDFFESHKDSRVLQGDLILALTRPYISTGLKISVCSPLYHNSLLNQRVAAIRMFADTEFLYQYMQSDYVLGLYQRRFGGSGLQPNLKMGDVTELVIPVPPLEEQHRIVAKVNKLMILCDQLKAQLKNAQTTQLHLADTVIENALAL